MTLSTIMGTSYACLGAVRNLEDVGKRMGADLLLNFLELSQGEVRRVYLPRTRVNGPLSRARSGEALRRKSSILYLQMEPLFAPVLCGVPDPPEVIAVP